LLHPIAEEQIFLLSGYNYVNQVSCPRITLDFIPSGNSVFAVDIGIKPFHIGDQFISPRYEGDTVLFIEAYNGWDSPADSTGANIGDDVPDGLVFDYSLTFVTSMTGVLSVGSAGTYQIQHSATNDYGTTDSPIYEVVVKKRFFCDFISSGATVHDVTTTSEANSQQLDATFIPSTSNVFAIDVGVKPYVQVAAAEDVYEGETVNTFSITAIWYGGHGITEGASVGDEPANLTYESGGDFQTHLTGVIAADTAGSYNAQFTATNPYGTTTSELIPFRVFKRLILGFISSTSNVFGISASSTINIDIGFISSTSNVFSVSIDSTIDADIGFISSTKNIFDIELEVGPAYFSSYFAQTFKEGDLVVFSSAYQVFDEGTSDDGVGTNIGNSPPPGITFDITQLPVNGLLSFHGTLEDVSSGLYYMQTRMTTSIGSADGPVIEWRIHDKVDLDFIPSSASVFIPNVSALVLNQIDVSYIGSSSSVYDITTNTTVDLSVGFIPSSSDLHVPELKPTSDVSIGLITSTKELYSVTLDSTIDISVGSIVSTNELYSISLDSTIDLSVGFIISSSDIFTPDLKPTLDVSIGTIASTIELYNITLDSTVDISIGTITSTSELYNISLDSTIDIGVDFAVSTNEVYDITLNYTIDANIGFIASSISLHTPNVTALVLNQIGMNFIGSTSDIYDPYIWLWRTNLNVGYIPSTSNLYVPELNSIKSIGIDLIASTSNLYNITLDYTIDFSVEFIASGITVFIPNVSALVLNQLDVNFIPSSKNIYGVTSQTTISSNIGFIASTKNLFNITTQVGLVEAHVDFIQSSSSVFDNTISGSINAQINSIPSSKELYNISLDVFNSLQIGFIGSSSSVFDVSTDGTVSTNINFITSSISLYEPTFTDRIIEIDVILFDLNINKMVDKSMNYDTMHGTALYIDKIASSSLNIELMSEIRVEL